MSAFPENPTSQHEVDEWKKKEKASYKAIEPILQQTLREKIGDQRHRSLVDPAHLSPIENDVVFFMHRFGHIVKSLRTTYQGWQSWKSKPDIEIAQGYYISWARTNYDIDQRGKGKGPDSYEYDITTYRILEKLHLMPEYYSLPNRIDDQTKQLALQYATGYFSTERANFVGTGYEDAYRAYEKQNPFGITIIENTFQDIQAAIKKDSKVLDYVMGKDFSPLGMQPAENPHS